VTVATDQQIANAALAAGFAGEDLVTGVAVALAESRGVMEARHANANGTVDLGLWQINSAHLKPGEMLAGWSEAELFDPKRNADAARIIWGRHGWAEWSTFNNQTYRLFVNRAKAVASTASAEGGGRAETHTENPLTEIAGTVTGIAGFLTTPRNWVRIAQGIVGVGAVLVGLTIVARSDIKKVVKSVV
jgi:hypothetical protein